MHSSGISSSNSVPLDGNWKDWTDGPAALQVEEMPGLEHLGDGWGHSGAGRAHLCTCSAKCPCLDSASSGNLALPLPSSAITEKIIFTSL